MGKTWQNWLAKRFKFLNKKQLLQRDILIFIDKQGCLYVVLIGITFVAGINYANNLILGFCFLISAVLCISFYLTFKQLHGLTLELVPREIGQVGQSVHLNFYFQQEKLQPRYLYIKTNDQCYQVYFSSLKHQLSIPFYPEKRGQLIYPTVQLYSIYPLGLVRAWTYLYHQKMTWIAPRSVLTLAENKDHQQRFELDQDEFRELREYRLGDTLQAVSWKQVARGQGLYIKVFEQYQHEHHIDIDYEKMRSSVHEEKLELMMGLVEQCEQQQCAYRLYLPQTTLALGLGDEQLLKAKQLLAQA